MDKRNNKRVFVELASSCYTKEDSEEVKIDNKINSK